MTAIRTLRGLGLGLLVVMVVLQFLGPVQGFVPSSVLARPSVTAAARRAGAGGGRLWMAAGQLSLEQQQKLPDLSQVRWSLSIGLG